MIQLPREFAEFLRSLNSTGVEYLLIGGYAVIYHGYYRSTGDIDVWIAVTPENARRVSEALIAFDFPPESVPPEMFLERPKVFRFGREPMRIELLTQPSGVDFAECFAERVMGELGGVLVPIISLERLKQNKRASGRDKDLADLKRLP